MANNQRTLRESSIIKGIGIFSGQEVTVEIHPAEINHGPRFELVTPGGIIPIPVAVENIVEAENRTVLASPGNKDFQINFVEHVLSTLHGMGIDNVLVRVDSVEIPLFDGSALPFLEAVDKTGIIEQDAPSDEIVIDKPIFIDDKALLMALPADTLRLTYYLDQPDDFAGKRLTQIEVTPENYRRRIGPARTFARQEQVEALLATGAVKNRDRDQVVVVYKDHISQPLRFADEFCYHKMLDILGDLYLTGKRLRAHIIGVRSGHYQNRLMARKIADEYLK